VSITVSGPSTALAYARALIARLGRGLATAGQHLRRALRLAWHLPRAVADATLAVVATDQGYTAVTGTIGRTTRAGGRLLARGLRWLGRGSANAVRQVAGVIDIATPQAGQRLRQVIDAIQARITGLFDTIEHALSQAASLVAMLTSTPLVRAVTTRLATVFSGLLAVHVVTQGALATRLIQAVPASVGFVAWATNPWMLLAGLAFSFAAVTVFAGVRLWQAGGPRPQGPTTDHSSDLGAVEQDGAFEAIVSRLRVVIEPDGSVRVDGVPADLPEPQQRDLATAAARAAVGQLEQIARHGRPISSAQRRAATKAAKAAARDWLTVGYLATA
jgi:hypothetical protein